MTSSSNMYVTFSYNYKCTILIGTLMNFNETVHTVPCFIRYQASLLGKRKVFNYRITFLLAFYAIGTNHRPIIKDITLQMQKNIYIWNTKNIFFCKYWKAICCKRHARNYIIQERNTCMNRNKNKRPMGLNGHTCSRDSMLTSLQKGLYLIRIINIIHNLNPPPGGHEIYNFGVR